MQSGKNRDELIEYIMQNREGFYRLAFSYVKNEATAMDMVQDAIVKALDKVWTLRNPEYIKTWFYRILINTCLMHLRESKKFTLVEYNEEIMAEPEFILEELDGISAEELQEAIGMLETNLKTIIFLRFYEEMSLQEIAQTTKTNINTVKTRLYRAIDILRDNLCDYEQGGKEDEKSN